MTRLNQVSSDTIRLAKRMAKNAKNEKAKPKMWKGKKIIPLKEWLAKENFITHEWRNYFPDEFLPYGLMPAYDFPEIVKWQNEWWSQFIEYMEVTRPASYGKYKCRNCMLNSSRSPRITTIRDAFLETYGISNDESFEFPCNVVNFFKCPYESKYAVRLNWYGYMWEVLEDVLKYNMRFTQHKRSTYHVDFVNDKISYPAGFDGFDSSPCKIENVLDKLKFPRVEDTCHEDLYGIITTRDKLRSVLEEYRDAPSMIFEKSLYYIPYVDYIKRNMDDMLNFFDEIKDNITLENLLDTEGRTLQEIKEMQKKWKEEGDRTSHGRPGHTRVAPILSGPCFSCGEPARINCKNCSAWMCLQHWKDHGVQAHNYAKQTN